MVPANPKLYHIAHVDRLASIIRDGCLSSDAIMALRAPQGSVIGMNHIKARRQTLELSSHPGLHVGECVPFYFCPRSVMLYIIAMANHPDLAYRGGQSPIVHLEVDLRETVAWVEANRRRWAFTLTNASSKTFEDRRTLQELDDIDWDAIWATDWRNADVRERKQAEFLVEQSVPWHLVERIGVSSTETYRQAINELPSNGHKPAVEILQEWYY